MPSFSRGQGPRLLWDAGMWHWHCTYTAVQCSVSVTSHQTVIISDTVLKLKSHRARRVFSIGVCILWQWTWLMYLHLREQLTEIWRKLKNEEFCNLQSVLTDVIQLMNCALELPNILISGDVFHSFAIMIHMVYYFPSFTVNGVTLRCAAVIC